MQLVDAALALWILLAAWAGARKGFAFTAAAVLSPAAGLAFAAPLADLLVFDGPAGPFVAYLLLSGAVFATAAAFRAGLRRAGMRAWDRHLGVLAGAAVGAALAVALAAGLLAWRPELGGPLRASRAGRLLGAAAGTVSDVLPRAARDVVTPWLVPIRRSPEGGRPHTG